MGDIAKMVNGWLSSDASALVLREYLIPVEGKESPFFPPTFAGSGSEGSSYCIDTMKDGTQTCLVDTVGSQANRMEPIFVKEPYRGLIPQVMIKAGQESKNICEVGHRAADALLMHSSIRPVIDEALKSLDNGDPLPLARIAPTSFVFGMWDSRGTQVKLPRIISSVIRAYDVDQFTRSAQYFPPVNYRENDLLGEVTNKKYNDARSHIGFNEIPSTDTHGGIIAHGEIRRDTVVNLAALRLIASDGMQVELQKYILSLSLVAATHGGIGYLRQGCILTRDPERGAPEWEIVYPDGKREKVEVDHESVLAYAAEMTRTFGKGDDRNDVKFDVSSAKRNIEEAVKSKKK